MSGDPIETDNGYLIHLVSSPSSGSMFGNESTQISVEVVFQTTSRLRIRISDQTNRFTVPIEIPTEGVPDHRALYQVTFTNIPAFGMLVTRSDTGEVVVDTGLPGMVFSDQFIQLPIKIAEGSRLFFCVYNK